MASSCMGVSLLFTNFLQPAQGGLKLKFTSNSKLNFFQHVENVQRHCYWGSVIWNKEHSLLFNLGVNKALLAFVISSLLSLGVTKIQIYRSFYNSRFWSVWNINWKGTITGKLWFKSIISCFLDLSDQIKTLIILGAWHDSGRGGYSP